MILYIARRLAAMVVVLLALVAIEFVLQQATPVDPVKVLLGPQATAEAQAEMASRLGLDKPLPQRYWDYLVGLTQGDLGQSIRTQSDVAADIRDALPITLELSLLALLFAIIGAGLLAFSSAGRWRTAKPIRWVLTMGASAPPFLLGLLGILFLANRWGLLPGNGRTSYADAPDGPTGMITVDSLIAGRPLVAWDAVQHLFLPSLCIALISAVAVGRVLRGSLLDNLEAPYIRTALAKGLSRHEVLRRHALRNSVGPALSMAGLQLGVVFASVVVIEQVFGIPGLGYYLAQAIPANDFPVISAVTLLLGVAYVLTNGAVDILQAVADPRVRL